MATQSASSAQAQSRIQEKLQEIQRLVRSTDVSSHARMLRAIDELRLTVETPVETTSRLNFQMLQNICIRIALEHNVYTALASHHRKPVHATELARECGIDELLLIRIMRVLTAIGLADEVGECEYAANVVTEWQTRNASVGAIKHHHDLDLGMAGRLVEYMRGPGIKQFADKEKGEQSLFDFTFGTHGIFGLLEIHPEQKKSFDDYMAGRPRSKAWCEMFPAAEKVIDRFDEKRGDRVLLVDVAGGVGHETVKFKEIFPEAKGRCIVQDLPLTLDKIGDLPYGIEKMHYDYFTPQPIRGAKAYFFRDVMHNWSDEKCVQFLTNTVEAMDEDYSILLIDDYVLPTTNAPLRAAEMDMLMFTHLSALERTKTQWERLFDQVGVESVAIWPGGRGEESVLECRKIKR